MMKSSVGAILLFVLAGGCGPSAPAVAPAEVTAAPTVSAAPPLDPTIVAVAAARAPASLGVDGDLGEWGALPAPQPSLPAPDEDERADKKAAPPPNPPEAASRLAFALTGEGAVIAAELGDAARAGIWLGIGARPAELPLLGQYFGRMGFVPLDCESSPHVEEDESGDQGYSFVANPAEVVAACRALEARYAAQKAQHERRFARLFKVDREGVHGVSDSGELVAVAGATAVMKPSAKGMTLEIALPLTALPRLAEAPVATMRLAARAVTSPKPPELGAGQWVWVKLPSAVSFEPLAALRAHALQRALDVGDGGVNTTSFKQRRGVSYQPGDPLHLEVVDSPACNAAIPREEELYRKQASLDDLEVGYVTSPRGYLCAVESEPWLSISKNGKLLEIVKLEGKPHGVIARDGELHALTYDESRWSEVPAAWSGIAIAPSGARRNVVEPLPKLGEPDPKAPSWSEVSEVSGKDLLTFGWRAFRGRDGVEATWRWDRGRRVYTGRWRRVIAPPKAVTKKPRPRR